MGGREGGFDIEGGGLVLISFMACTRAAQLNVEGGRILRVEGVVAEVEEASLMARGATGAVIG